MPLHLDPNSLDWALHHIESLGDTDIFPIPFEYKAIREFWTTNQPASSPKQNFVVRDWLESQDLLTWIPRAIRRCLSPKHRFGFRASTQLDPLDTIIFTALLYEIGHDLESHRVLKSEDVVHSYRFMPDHNGLMYDPDYNYDSFRIKSVNHASANECKWVVVADIADFYPRLYSHPLENALITATSKKDHVKVINKLLSKWNYSVSYGVPVGPAASRLLAEIAIADVDAALRSDSLNFVRFVDDYRIFVKTEREAYSALALLANSLFEMHGLTLQQHKTYIQSADAFMEDNLDGDSETERHSLAEKFEHILGQLGISSWYSDIDYDSLEDDIKKEIDSLNLVSILEEYIDSDENIDPRLVRFILRRLTQLDDDTAIDTVVNSMQQLYPVFVDAIGYLTSLRTYNADQKSSLGKKLLDLIDDDVVGHLEYHRAWILSTFTENAEWNNNERFTPLYTSYPDPFTRRDVILALGRARRVEWFKTNKRHVTQFASWEKRAFLAAASCLPGDEAKHWYNSIAPTLDPLETIVVDWARRFPF